MKRETPITMRCLALIMALAMFFTCSANLGLALQVFADAEETYSLYGIVADNYGNDAMKQAAKSGALVGDQQITVQKPSAAEPADLLLLEDTVLKAQPYSANYNNLNWVPYSYGDNGTEKLFENGYEADWAGKQAKVQYRLDLSSVYTAEQAEELLAAIAELQATVAAQNTALNRLNGVRDDMAQLDNTVLDLVYGASRRITFVDDETQNKAIQKHFQDAVDVLQDECMASGRLQVYNSLGDDGMTITEYYQNSAIEQELELLSQRMAELLPDAAYEGYFSLIIDMVVNENPERYGQYAGYGAKVAELKGKILDINAALTPSDTTMVVTEDADKLNTLLTALVGGTATYASVGAPYLADTLLVTDSSSVAVKVNVQVGEHTTSYSVSSDDRDHVWTEDEINGLIAQAKTFAAEKVGGETVLQEHYVVSGTEELEALIDTTSTQKTTTVTVTYTPKIYAVTINGSPVEYTVEKPTVTLAAPNMTGYQNVYKYTVGGVVNEVIAKDHTHQSLDLSDLLGQVTEITCTMIHYASEDIKDDLAGAKVLSPVVDAATGELTGLIANLDLTQDSIVQMANELRDLGYTYIALNDDNVLLGEDGYYSVQAIIDTVLEDNAFSNETLIALKANNGGHLFDSTMDLGSSAANIVLNDLTLTFNLNSLNAKASEYLGYLDQIKSYVSFQSNNGVLDIELNLPEKVYEVYLTAMIAEGTVDIDNAAAVEKYIAVHFIGDYIAMITKSDATTTTFKNTIEMLYQVAEKASNVTESVDKIPDVSVDSSDLPNAAVVTNYEEYYQWLKKTINGATYNEATGTIDALLSANGTTAIEKLLAMAGVDAESVLELVLVKEYATGDALGANISVDVNADHTFEALVIDSVALKDGAKALKPLLKQLNSNMTPAELMDWAVEVKATGLHTGIDYTSDLPARVASVKGGAVVVLLADVDGNLTFNGTTILDLNGMTVNGSIAANDSLYIMDSSLDTDNGGKVTGTVSGSDVTIVGGTYAGDVAAYLPDGYVQDNGTVHNCMYTIDVVDGNLTFEINADYMMECDGYLPSVKALAADIALDLAMNLYPAASLSVDGCELYNINNSTQLANLLKLALDANSGEYLIDEALLTLSVPGMADFINIVMEDLLSFGEIADSLSDDSAFASYALKAAPYAINVEQITDGDYMTVGVVADADSSKSVTVSLKMVGNNSDKLAACFDILDAVVEEASIKLVDVKDLTYDAKNFALSGGVEAYASLDLTNYAEQVMVVLAHGLYNDGNTANDAKADKMIAALNDAYGEGGSANTNALHDAFNALTAEEVLTALKVLNRNDTLSGIYAGLVQNHGLTVTYAEINATVEEAIIVALSAVGKMMEELDINGNSNTMDKIQTMADAENVDESCHVVSYEHSITYSRSANVAVTEVLNFLNTHGINVIRYLDAYGINVDGYGANLNLTASAAGLNVKLFDECAHEWDVVTVQPSCSKDGTLTNGSVTKTCKHCGKQVVETITASHTFGEWQCNGEEHWRVCEVCGYIERDVHHFGDWATVKEPTTTEYGWCMRVCTICGYKQTQPIDKLVAPTTPTTPASPSTSPVTADSFNVYLWSILTIVSGAAVAGLFVWKKRKFLQK